MSSLNDPRVFFAAERTLMSWTRTSLALMGFGFVVERFGLFVTNLISQHSEPLLRGLSFWIGLSFILLGVVASVGPAIQFRSELRRLQPEEIPDGYFINLGPCINLVVAVLGLALTAYLFRGSLL